MIFNNFSLFWKRDKDFSEKSEKIRQELIWLTKERDKVLEEIREQRRGNIEVFHNTNYIKQDISSLENILIETKKAIEKEQNNFHTFTEKQKIAINKLNKDINDKLQIFEVYNNKKLIDIDSINLKYKEQKQAKNIELQALQDDIDKLKKEKQIFWKWKEQEEERINNLVQYNETTKQNLKEEEKRLKVLKERLQKLKKDLKNNQTNYV